MFSEIVGMTPVCDCIFCYKEINWKSHMQHVFDFYLNYTDFTLTVDPFN